MISLSAIIMLLVASIILYVFGLGWGIWRALKKRKG